MELPYEFNQIINYNNLYNVQSDFVGYTYNAKDNSIQLNISNLDNSNTQDIYDEIADMLYESKKTTEDVKKIKTKLYKIQKDLENNKLPNEIDAKDIPIKAGVNGNTIIGANGIISFDKDNPNNMIRIVEGKMGFSKNGLDDFEPIIDSNGVINSKFLPQLPQININNTIEKDGQVQSTQSGGNGTNENSSNKDSTTENGNIQNTTYINNPRVIYENLPFKIIRNKETRKIEKIEYYRDKVLAYVETYMRNENNKIVNIELQSVDTGKSQTTTLERDENGKVEFVNINNHNESVVEE